MFTIIFGVPGTGKTTHAAKMVQKYSKKGIKVYSNVDIVGCYRINSTDIGKYDISDGILILDEASIDYNNRKFKTMPQSAIEWFKLYRHYGITDIFVYSQSYDDMDITLRRLADRLYVVRRTVLPWLSILHRISVRIDIDEQTHQIMDIYKWKLDLQFVWLPKYWKYFDSWTRPQLPVKDFPFLSPQKNGFADLVSVAIENCP